MASWRYLHHLDLGSDRIIREEELSSCGRLMESYWRLTANSSCGFCSIWKGSRMTDSVSSLSMFCLPPATGEASREISWWDDKENRDREYAQQCFGEAPIGLLLQPQSGDLPACKLAGYNIARVFVCVFCMCQTTDRYIWDCWLWASSQTNKHTQCWIQNHVSMNRKISN